MVVTLAKPVPASLWLGWVENLCVRFSSHHMKIRGCNCWQWPGPAGGKSPFLSTSMFDSWPFSYWPSYLHYQHVPCDGYNLPQLSALSRSRVHRDNCLLWVDRECLSAGTCLFCPSTPQLLSHPWSLLECHHVSIIVSWVWGPWACPFYAVSQSHKKCFSGPSHQTCSREEKKLSVYSLWPNPSTPLVRLFIVVWVAVRCCSALCLSLPR